MNVHADRLANAFARMSTILDAYARNRGQTLGMLPPPEDEPAPGSALDILGDWFDLSAFERSVLVLAAGAEMSADIARQCAMAQGDATMAYPTMLLALAVFADEDGASHAAFSPSAPLRRYHLVVPAGDQSGGRLQQRLHAPEALLATLAGEPTLDPALDALLEPITPDELLPSEAAFVAMLADTSAAAPDALLHLATPPSRRALMLVAAAIARLGMTPFHLPLTRLMVDADRRRTLTLWQRDRIAFSGALIVSFDDLGSDAQAMVLSLIADPPGPLFLVGAGGTALAERSAQPIVRMPVPKADPRELADDLAAALSLAPDPALIGIVEQFRLPRDVIQSCGRIAAARGGTALDQLLQPLRGLLRDQVREGMIGLADRIEVRLSLEDLVLPPSARAVLQQIVARQRYRSIVLRDWGFGGAGGGAQGMSVVFSGPSGTGKTMAAEALAHALELDLYRVDLSRIVDKYIGETEKRLAALFDAADASDAVLLFDEADVLFGRRTEVRDSHDRYANLEVGYLLQRIEAFRGVAVLTTNLPNAIDDAFARRFAFMLGFEFPDQAERAQIWQRAIPAAAPSDALDLRLLGALTLTGGQIRVISVNAAMLAAEQGESIGMKHIARAIEVDYAKQRRRMPADLFKDWPL